MARDIVYWDSVAFLGLLNDEADKKQQCEDVWVAAENGLVTLVTSTLTVAEVIYAKGVPKMDSAKRPLVNAFFRAPHIVQKPLTRVIAELARDIVWDSNVKPKDAIHVATAGFHRISTLNTFDDPLLKLGKVDVNGFVVEITKPYAPRQLEITNLKPTPES